MGKMYRVLRPDVRMSKNLSTGCWYRKGMVKAAEDDCSELPDQN